MCIFPCLLDRNAVCTLLCTADSCTYARYVLNPDVEFTVFKIVFNKNIFLQGSDTNLEFNR